MAPQAELRQRARPQEVLHPGVRAAASLRHRGPGSASGPGLHQVRVSVPHPGVRAGASRHRAPAWWLEREWHLEPAIRQPEARRDVRAGAYRGVQPALRQACCPEPVSRSAQVLLTVQVWPSGQARLAARSALRAQETRGSPSAQAWAQVWSARRGLPQGVAEVA